VETLLGLRDALSPDARVPLGSDPGPAAAPNPARAAAGGGAGTNEADAGSGPMDLDDEGPCPGPGPSGGGGRGGPAPDEERMLPPLMRPAPIVEDEEEDEEEEEDAGAAAASASAAGGRATPAARAERRDGRGGRAGAAARAGRGAAAARAAGGATQSAGERAARVLPVAFALAEAGLDALAADTAAAEALADGAAAPGDPLPLLSQGCAGPAHVCAHRNLIFFVAVCANTHLLKGAGLLAALPWCESAGQALTPTLGGAPHRCAHRERARLAHAGWRSARWCRWRRRRRACCSSWRRCAASRRAGATRCCRPPSARSAGRPPDRPVTVPRARAGGDLYRCERRRAAMTAGACCRRGGFGCLDTRWLGRSLAVCAAL